MKKPKLMVMISKQGLNRPSSGILNCPDLKKINSSFEVTVIFTEIFDYSGLVHNNFLPHSKTINKDILYEQLKFPEFFEYISYISMQREQGFGLISRINFFKLVTDWKIFLQSSVHFQIINFHKFEFLCLTNCLLDLQKIQSS